jgi:hypothetical protein
MQKKKLCTYCGALTNGYICFHCKEKMELWRTIRKMVKNKIIEVRGNNGIQKKG